MLSGALVVAVTELLGAIRLIRPVPVGVAWAVVGAVGLWWWRRYRRRVGRGNSILSAFARAPVLWGIAFLFLGLTVVTGLFGAPNAWDSLTYHLPRVERWVEQGHLGFWPTSVDRQLWMAPWSGYAILQFRLLTGGDRLAFLPSWLGYLGCILLTAQIVRQLGGNQRQAAFGALIIATMPVAVLHASSTQTDLPAAFWVLCMAALVLEAWQRREAATDGRHATWLGLAVSLAVATKGTVWLALLPWLVFYAWAVVRAAGWRAITRPLLIGSCAVLVLNGAIFARNVGLFGDPLGDTTARGFLRLAPFSLNGGAANLLANLSLHMGTPWAAWNEWWTGALIWVQRTALGVDPALLFPYFGGFRVQAFSTHESLAGNPVHLVLGLGLVAWVGLAWRRLRGSPVLAWALCGVAAIVLHGLLIRWQPFGARLQLASLVWLASAAAMALRHTFLRTSVALVSVLVAVPALGGNYLRPLWEERSVFRVPREEQYFAERPELRPVVRRVFSDVQAAGCSNLGLVAGYDTPEYLLMTEIRRGAAGTSLEHIYPRSRSAALSAGRPSSRPCAVLAFNRPSDFREVAEVLRLRVRWYDQEVGLLAP